MNKFPLASDSLVPNCLGLIPSPFIAPLLLVTIAIRGSPSRRILADFHGNIAAEAIRDRYGVIDWQPRTTRWMNSNTNCRQRPCANAHAKKGVPEGTLLLKRGAVYWARPDSHHQGLVLNCASGRCRHEFTSFFELTTPYVPVAHPLAAPPTLAAPGR